MTPSERSRLTHLSNHARRVGRDVFEYLDARYLILTEKRVAQIRYRNMHELADMLENASIKQIMAWYGEGERSSALEAQRAIVAMIRNQAAKEGK